ncbi:hypothetical protein [Actinoplanes sp. CA-252034]|uniref:hypothetical protein n=1 Tax=Actinoplanes sp. CA-252034 TaxID=3239906 RepID=UPI003D98ACBD
MAYPSEQQPFEGPAPTDWRQWFRLQGRPRPLQRSYSVAFGVAAVIAVLGALLGLLWGWLAPTIPVVKLADGSIVVTDPSPEQYIAADGWFTLLGLGFGLIVTIGSWLVLRRDRGPFLLLGIVGGTFVAGRWVAPAVGELLGRDAYLDWTAAAAQGATYLAPPEVQSLGPKLVPAFIAAIVVTLLAGWSNDPDLDHPGAHPGYGPNHDYPPYGPGPGDQAPGGEPAPYAMPGGHPSPYAVPGDQSSPYAVPGDQSSPYAAPGDQPSPYAVPGDQSSPYAVPADQTSSLTQSSGTAGNGVAPERPDTEPAQPPAASGRPREEPRQPS